MSLSQFSKLDLQANKTINEKRLGNTTTSNVYLDIFSAASINPVPSGNPADWITGCPILTTGGQATKSTSCKNSSKLFSLIKKIKSPKLFLKQSPNIPNRWENGSKWFWKSDRFL